MLHSPTSGHSPKHNLLHLLCITQVIILSPFHFLPTFPKSFIILLPFLPRCVWAEYEAQSSAFRQRSRVELQSGSSVVEGARNRTEKNEEFVKSLTTIPARMAGSGPWMVSPALDMIRPWKEEGSGGGGGRNKLV